LIDADPEPYLWAVPGNNVSLPQCLDLCETMQGCYHATIDAAGKAAQGQCNMVFPRRWPQPLASSQPYSAKTWLWSQSERSGTIWTDDDGTIWYYAWDDGNTLDNYAGTQSLHATGAQTANAQIMWRYESKHRVWSPVPSSLTMRPDPQAGMAQWVDASGSLFLVGEDAATNKSRYVPFGSEGIEEQPEAGGGLQLWKFDTVRTEWQRLKSTGAEKTWPRARLGATAWRERSTDNSMAKVGTDGALAGTRTVVWMFGGGSPSETVDSHSAAGSGRTSSELWQYVYGSFDHGHRLGRWTLVTAVSPDCPSTGCTYRQAEPLFECYVHGKDAGSRQSNAVVCPMARTHATSWPSPNGAAGKSS
jgi:hypothetical protein